MIFPAQIGRYTLLSPLGEGGAARVYRAELRGMLGFSKEVAIKTLKAEDGQTPDLKQIQRFIYEGRLGGLLHHPNIIDVYELGEWDGEVFIAMEYVEGWSVRELCRPDPMPLTCALEVAIGICRGLEAAHGHEVKGVSSPVIHRDLKPANILVGRYGSIKVADFGIAWMKGEGRDSSVVGTLAYMAPEQLRGGAVDHRADIFGLGATLYEMVTGRRLFLGDKEDLIRHRLEVDNLLEDEDIWAPIMSTCPPLRVVLEQCLRGHPALRYESAYRVRRALQQIYDGLAKRIHLSDWVGPSTVTEDMSEAETEPLDGISSENLTNLHRPLDVFFGHSSLLDEVVTSVGVLPVVVLLGLGGMGKTRIAIESGWSVLPDVPGGVWFCDLQESRTQASVLFAVANMLGVPLTLGSEEEHAQRIGHVLAQRAATVLILDNVEQVTVELRTLVSLWTQLSPQSTFWLTTREPINLPSARVLRVKSLGAEESLAMFLDRTARPLEKDAPGLIELVEKFDGMPLVIELAARRTQQFSLQELSERLTKRFRVLQQPGAWPAQRHGTLRAVLDSTWGALSPCHQDALMQCSVFRGGFQLEAAETVIDLSSYDQSPWVVDVLQELLDKSLLTIRTVEGQPRISLLVSVSDYALEMMARVDTETVRKIERRHAAYFSRFGEEGFLNSLLGFGGIEKRKRLTQELDNLVVATSRSVAYDWKQEAVYAGLAALEILNYTGPLHSAVALVQTLLASKLSSAIDARFLLSCGWCFVNSGDLPEAEKLFLRGLSEAVSSGDKRREGLARGRLGVVYRLQHRDQESELAFRMSLKILEDVGLHRDLGKVRSNFANLYLYKFQPDCAERELELAFEDVNRCGDLRLKGTHLSSFGIVRGMQERFDEAGDYFLQSLKYIRQVGDRMSEASHLGNWAQLERRCGRKEEAKVKCYESITVCRNLGLRLFESVSLGQLGSWYLVDGDYGQAIVQLELSTALKGQVGDKRGCLRNRVDLAIAYYLSDQEREALTAVEKVISLAEETSSHWYNTWGLFFRGLVKTAIDLTGAQRDLNDSLRLARSEKHHDLESVALSSLAVVAARGGDLDAADSLLREAGRVENAMSTPQIRGTLALHRGEVALLLADFEAAKEALVMAQADVEVLGLGEGPLFAGLVKRFEARL